VACAQRLKRFLVKKKLVRWYLYFSILTILSLHTFFIAAFSREPVEPNVLVQQVCNKSTDDGSELEFKNLTKEEYSFINAKTNWLPSIPDESQSVNVFYYRELLFSDYKLRVNFALKGNEPLDSIEYPGWKLVGKSYRYERVGY